MQQILHPARTVKRAETATVQPTHECFWVHRHRHGSRYRRCHNERRRIMAVALLKRRFTADEYQRMGQAGILSEDDRVELIGGEILTMSPIGTRHNACVSSGTHA